MRRSKRSHTQGGRLLCIITMTAIYTMNSLVISPLATVLSSDVVYSDTILPILLQCVAEFSELCAIAVCYAVMLLTLYHSESAGRIFVIFGLATAYKYTGNTLTFWALSGSVPKLWIWDALNIIYFTALELAQLLVIFLFVRVIIGKYTEKTLVAQRVYEKTGERAEPEAVYPFKVFYSKDNCILRSAYVCALVTFIAKLCGTVADDVWTIIAYGMPSEGMTWVYMAINYISKAIFGLVVYMVIYTVLQSMLRRESHN